MTAAPSRERIRANRCPDCKVGVRKPCRVAGRTMKGHHPRRVALLSVTHRRRFLPLPELLGIDWSAVSARLGLR